MVHGRRAELVAAWCGREPELRELVEAWVRPFAEFVGSRHPSYWARFNEDELRRYPLAKVPRLRPNISGRPQEESLLLLIGLFEQIEQRICAGGLDRDRHSHPDGDQRVRRLGAR